jgi:flavodoxin
MKAVVVYESMYGNTHLVADAIADGLRAGPGDDVTVLPVEAVDAGALTGVDLLVVGGPTHVHGLSRPNTRKAAAETAEKPGSGLELEPDAEGPGLREWFDAMNDIDGHAAAFDTRADGPAPFTGRASKGIAKRLRGHGCQLVCEPTSFLVTKQNHLVEDEERRAREWGRKLHDTFAKAG